MSDSTLLGSGLRLKAGSVINGRFELIEKLGRGGFARVWRARHRLGGFDVALKFVDPHHDWLGVDEFRLLSSLYHPNIIRIMDIMPVDDIDSTRTVQEPRQHFITMEYVPGTNLIPYACRTRELDPAKVLYWYQQMVRVLSYLHSERLMHRDIKPGNIIIDEKTLSPRAVLIDFNLSSISNPTAGTPRYKCPLVLNEGRWHRFADIWALAVTFYELISGSSLFISSRPTYDVILSDAPGIPFPRTTFRQICKIIKLQDIDPETDPAQYDALFALPQERNAIIEIPDSLCEKYDLKSKNKRFLVLHMLKSDDPSSPRARKQIVREALATAARPADRELVDKLERIFYQLANSNVIEYHGKARKRKVALSRAFLTDFESDCVAGA